MTKCKGCGIELQDKNIDELGYVEDLNNELCMRCFRLSHYGEYKKVSFTNDDYKKLLSAIPKDSLIVYTSDILSLNFDRLDDYENVLLVITKKDILPKSLKDEKIVDYVKKNTNIKNVLVISSKKNYNIDTLYNYICRNSKNRAVYFIGDTNSGKSTLINKLISNYTDIILNKVTVSMYPSTTLSLIPIELNNVVVMDTPGLIDDGSMVNIVDKVDLKKITPTKEIKPKSCQITGKGSIVIDKYARIDYETDVNNSIVIYASNNVGIRFNSLNNDYLKDLDEYSFKSVSKKDIVIPGLCFIKLGNNIDINIYVYNGVKPYLRDNLI